MDEKVATYLTKIVNEQAAQLIRIEAVQAKQAGDIAEIKDLLKAMYPLLIASNARNDAQSKRIDDLSRIVAAMVPQRQAAVGER